LELPATKPGQTSNTLRYKTSLLNSGGTGKQYSSPEGNYFNKSITVNIGTACIAQGFKRRSFEVKDLKS
jgi:hypothetical protein